MRVLHVTSSLYGGGAEAVLYRLCTYPYKHVSHTVICLTSEGAYGDRLKAAGVTLHALRMRRGLLDPCGLLRLYRTIRTSRPDIIQTWMYHGDLVGGLVARLASRRPVVWGLHNSTLDRVGTSPTTRWTAKACALLSNYVPSRIVSCSQTAAAIHVHLGYPKDKIALIANGYDVAEFSPDPIARDGLRRQLGISPSEPLIGMVARWNPQKDVANLLNALARLARQGRHVTCLLIGEGMDKTNRDLELSLANQGLVDQVRLLGPRSDIPAVMNALDLHVLPSAYGEAFPNVVAEAMACGTPCIVTDVGDSRLMVGNTGWVVPPRDSSALSGAIEAAIPQIRTSCWAPRQAACRERVVANFGLVKMAANYESVWRALVQGRS